jgi:hypothetical protein
LRREPQVVASYCQGFQRKAGQGVYMTQLVHLAYVSTSRRELSIKCISDLLEVGRKSNKEHGITGMLLYKNGTFMQVIEGLESDIHLLFLNIQQDSRHIDINLLSIEPIPHRSFSEWSMEFTTEPSEKLVGFTDFLSLKSELNIPSLAAQTLLLGFK